MKFEDIKVGGVYFYNWQEFIIITSITNEFIKFKSVNINLSTNEEGVSIKRGQTAVITFEANLVDNLREYKDAKFLTKNFAKNIITLLFKLPKN